MIYPPHEVHKNRFSGAASSDDAEDIPFVHPEGDVIKYQVSAKLHAQVSDGKQG